MCATHHSIITSVWGMVELGELGKKWVLISVKFVDIVSVPSRKELPENLFWF
jgi:hypothetical protein